MEFSTILREKTEKYLNLFRLRELHFLNVLINSSYPFDQMIRFWEDT